MREEAMRDRSIFEVISPTMLYTLADDAESARDIVDEVKTLGLHDPAEAAEAQEINRHARRGEARAWLEGFIADFETNDITNECVMWPFSTNGGAGGRYPQIRIDGRTVRVTRHVFERITGRRLEAGELIRHTCDTTGCVNPRHFELGSHLDNMADMRDRSRQAARERNGRARRLTEAQVRDIRQLARDSRLKGRVSFIAREYGVSPTTIASIVTGKTWRDSDTISGDNLI